jgi:hypothetical protein
LIEAGSVASPQYHPAPINIARAIGTTHTITQTGRMF